MDIVTKGMLGLQALAALVSIIILVYLIRRRIRIKKTENFEQRSN